MWRRGTCRQDVRYERLLSVCLLEGECGPAALGTCDWSNALPIADVGELTIVCREANRRNKVFIAVDVQVSRQLRRVPVRRLSILDWWA